MLVFSAMNVVGFSRHISIAEEVGVVSNHRGIPTDEVSQQCESKPAEIFDNLDEEIYSEGLDPNKFQLLVWNVLKGSRQAWRDDFRRLSDESDIIALQEAQLHDEFHASLADSELHWDLTTAFHYGGKETGVLIGSEIKPGIPCGLQANEPLLRIPKTALVTEYKIQGTNKTLLVANIHMINFSLSTVEYKRQLSALMAAVQNHEGPMIITGDFNTWSQRRMSIIKNMAFNLGLTAVEYDDDHRLKVFGNPVDHVYYRGLETLEANTESVESSDHNPMMVTFKLAGA